MKYALHAAFVMMLLGFGASAGADENLAKSKNCLACHAIDSKKVGPAFKEVAGRYAGKADAEAMLADKVIKGGGGNWGGMAMPPNPQVTPDEAKTLVHWILGLK